MAKNMSEIIQNISDIFPIISLVFSICCGKFFTHTKKIFFSQETVFYKAVYTENILCKEHFAFLEKTLLNCSSGKDKLIADLPADVKFAHKTGHSDRTPEGILIRDADAGIISETNRHRPEISHDISGLCLQAARPASQRRRIAATSHRIIS